MVASNCDRGRRGLEFVDSIRDSVTALGLAALVIYSLTPLLSRSMISHFGIPKESRLQWAVVCGECTCVAPYRC